MIARNLAAGAGGTATWGSITGTLNDQTDLASALAGKQTLDGQLTDLAGLSYAGNALKIIRVNAGETAWELATTSGGSYTDEEAQDAVGTILTDTATIDFTYNDGAPSITADIKTASVTLAMQADVATATVFYRKTAGTGVPEVQTLATLKTDLGLTGTNSGDQTTIVGISGTKAQFDTACSDGNFLYVGDVTQYTDEMAEDAIGAMIDGSLNYIDATPLLQRSALTGDISASAGSNTTTLATVNSNVGTFGSATKTVTFTVNGKGLITAASEQTVTPAAKDGAKVRKNTALTGQNFTAGVTQVWGTTEDWDTGSYHDNVTNTGRLTVTNAGFYLVRCNMRLDNVTASNQINVEIQRFNSSNVFQEVIARSNFSSAGTSPGCCISGDGEFAAGDYVIVVVLVGSDTSVDVPTTAYFEILRIG